MTQKQQKTKTKTKTREVLVKKGKTVSVKKINEIKEIKSVNEGSEFFLLPEQIKKMEDSCESSKDYAITLLLSRCGVRRMEVTHLKIEDIGFGRVSKDNDNGWLHLVSTKNAVKRDVPVDRETLRQIKHVIGKRKYGFVFLSDSGSSISNRNINYIVEKIGEKAEIEHPNPDKKRLNPHIFRHSFARNFLRAGGRLEVLQKILGHANINTTIAIYGKPSLNDLQDEYNKVKRGVD